MRTTSRTYIRTHIRTQYKIQDTHIRNNTLQTYISVHTNTTICSTQYAHNMHTHTTQRTTICSTQNTAQNTAQNNTLVCTVIHIYSFDFYHLQQYIEKLYNTAIYKLYTNYIHFARLINKVSKITITLI